jgi:hypothetical protein
MTAVGMKDIKFDDFTKQEHVQEGDFIDDKDMPVYTCMRKLIKRISKYRWPASAIYFWILILHDIVEEWAFLQILGDGTKKTDRQFCVSFNGKTVSSKLLSTKMSMLTTEMACVPPRYNHM